MPASEERVTTLEEIVRNHDAQLQRQQRSVELLTTLAENSTRVQQQIVQTMEALTTRFGQVEETNRLLVTGMEALQGGVGALQTEMKEFRTQVDVWAQTVEQRFDALPEILARAVTDEVRPIATELRSVNSTLHALPEAIEKAVAEEFRPLLSLREDVEALKRRVEALEKKPRQ